MSLCYRLSLDFNRWNKAVAISTPSISEIGDTRNLHITFRFRQYFSSNDKSSLTTANEFYKRIFRVLELFVLYRLHRLLALIFSRKATDTILELLSYSNTRWEVFWAVRSK